MLSDFFGGGFFFLFFSVFGEGWAGGQGKGRFGEGCWWMAEEAQYLDGGRRCLRLDRGQMRD